MRPARGHANTCGVYRIFGWKFRGSVARNRSPHSCGTRQTALRRLLAGHVVFDEVRVLQPGELDGKAVFDMADYPAGGLADGNHRADRGSQIRSNGDRRAGLRQVDYAAAYTAAVWQDEARHRIARRKAAVAAVFREV